MLPERLEQLGIGSIDEDIDDPARARDPRRRRARPRQYLLQIFLKESAGLYGDPERRARSSTRSSSARAIEGFGAGNFRALFESIERQQQHERGLHARVS